MHFQENTRLTADSDQRLAVLPHSPIQPALEAVVSDVCDRLVAELGPLLDSIYLYGSVARGTAIIGSSDLDLTLVLTHAPSALQKTEIEELRQTLQTQHQSVTKIDFDLGTRAEVLAPANKNSWAYWIKHHCRLLWGHDLGAQFEAFLPSRAIALAVNAGYAQVLHDYTQRIEAENTLLVLQRLQKEASRKLIRSTNILRPASGGPWPESLEDFVQQCVRQYPAMAEPLDFFQQHAHVPTASAAVFAQKLRLTLRWLEQEEARVLAAS